MTPDANAAVGLTDIDACYPDDPEGGRRLHINLTVDRSPASHLLGIAVAVAAGRIVGSPVVDERGSLTGERLADPEMIIAGLRHVGPPAEHLRDVAHGIVEPFGVVADRLRRSFGRTHLAASLRVL